MDWRRIRLDVRWSYWRLFWIPNREISLMARLSYIFDAFIYKYLQRKNRKYKTVQRVVNVFLENVPVEQSMEQSPDKVFTSVRIAVD